MVPAGGLLGHPTRTHTPKWALAVHPRGIRQNIRREARRPFEPPDQTLKLLPLGGRSLRVQVESSLVLSITPP
eukprot:8894187-Pyramimonas_sp.AAC.1